MAGDFEREVAALEDIARRPRAETEPRINRARSASAVTRIWVRGVLTALGEDRHLALEVGCRRDRRRLIRRR